MDLDIFNASPDPESELSIITVMGVSWQQIRDTNGLIDKLVTIDGGMMPGVPLATYQARKRGHLLTGNIQKAWGNWVGTDMSVGMAISVRAESGTDDSSKSSAPGGSGSPGGGSSAAPSVQLVPDMDIARYARGNRTGFRSITSRGFSRGQVSVNPSMDAGGFDLSGFGVDIGPNLPLTNYIGGGLQGLTRPLNVIHNLLPNTPLSDAIRQTMSTAFPGLPVNIAISSLLKLPYQDAGMYQTLQQYASYIFKLSNSILGTKNYQGIHMTSDGTSVDVWDGTQSLGHEDLSPLDLIGQPTWVDRYKVQIKLVMRGGLKPGMTVSLPPGIPMNVSMGAIQIGTSEQRSNVSIPGTFYIYKVRHIGAYRNPDGNNWCTILETVLQEGAAAGDPNPIKDAEDATKVDQRQNPIFNPPQESVTPQAGPQIAQFGSVFRRTPRMY
jgi:hypothetical protein